MAMHPRLHRDMRVSGDPDELSHELASQLPRHGLAIQQHYPGSRVCASVMRLKSLSGGQIVRIDLHPIDGHEVEIGIESKFKWPGVDFTHENEKNVALVEDLVRQVSARASGAVAA